MDAAEREALASDLAGPVSYLAGLVCGMRKIGGADGDGWQHLTGCFSSAADELGAIFEAALDGQGAYTRVLSPGSPERRSARQAGPETARIRWTAIDGTVVSWFGFVGSAKSALFQIMHPVSSEPEGARFDERALCAAFSGVHDEPRYGGKDPEAPDKLKAEAERWLEEYISSLGASFPEADRESA